MIDPLGLRGVPGHFGGTPNPNTSPYSPGRHIGPACPCGTHSEFYFNWDNAAGTAAGFMGQGTPAQVINGGVAATAGVTAKTAAVGSLWGYYALLAAYSGALGGMDAHCVPN